MTERLPLWHFFQRLEKELSYERWIDKYRLFLHALTHGYIAFDDDWKGMIQFCKILLLQHFQDEVRFELLLREAIAEEKEILLRLLRTSNAIKDQDKKNIQQKTSDAGRAEENVNQQTAPAKPDLNKGNEADKITDDFQTGSEDISLFYHPPLDKMVIPAAQTEQKVPVNFLQTDEYFPVTRRQMVKSWQFLRHKEKGGSLNEIDINGTVKKIASEGLYLEPVYLPGTRNREDTLMIFADYHGSMIPFHELTNRLIQTARTEGGHYRAPVYFFQNYPQGYVYRHSNLTEPVKIKESMLKANRNITIAIIISDAGAARGNTNEERKRIRLENTRYFLRFLEDCCAHVVWLNPMPRHRWKNTAAELIMKEVFLMAPILDYDHYNFQDTLRTILKQHQKNETGNL